ALPRRPGFWREMRRHVVVGAEDCRDRAEQLLLHLLRLAEAAPGESVLLGQDLAPDDLVDPLLLDLQLPQLLCELDGVAADAEISRRALQHRDMLAFVRDRRD